MNWGPKGFVMRSQLLPLIGMLLAGVLGCPATTEPCPVGFVRFDGVCLRGCPPGSLRADGGCDCPDGLISRDTPAGLVCDVPSDGGSPSADMRMDMASEGDLGGAGDAGIRDGSVDLDADAPTCTPGVVCELPSEPCLRGEIRCEDGVESCEVAGAEPFGVACERMTCADCVCAGGGCVSPLAAPALRPVNPSGPALLGFGHVVVMNADGDTLLVGVPEESTGAGYADPPGPPRDTAAPASGAVFVYRLRAGRWEFDTMLKARQPRAGDRFGSSIAVNESGETIVVGAPFESSSAPGLRDLPMGTAVASGAVHVFIEGEVPLLLKAPEFVDPDDRFGASVSVDGPGFRLAVGAPGDDSDEAGAPGSNGTTDSGAFHLFEIDSAMPVPVAYYKPDVPVEGEQFGSVLAVSTAADSIAAGVPLHASAVVDGIDPTDPASDQLRDRSAPGSGAVYLFGGFGPLPELTSVLRASEPDAGDAFGSSVAWQRTETLLAVGAPGEDGSGQGANPVERDDGRLDSGAVYLFEPEIDATETDYLKAETGLSQQEFGFSLDFLGDILIVGGPGDSASVAGTDPVLENGAVFVFRRPRDFGGWSVAEVLRPLSDVSGGRFGTAVALGEQLGARAVVSAPRPAVPGAGLVLTYR